MTAIVASIVRPPWPAMPARKSNLNIAPIAAMDLTNLKIAYCITVKFTTIKSFIAQTPYPQIKS